MTIPKIEEPAVGSAPPWRFARDIDHPDWVDLAPPPAPSSKRSPTLHLVVLLGLTTEAALQAFVRRRLAVDPDREPPPVRKADCFSAAVSVDLTTGRPIASSLTVSRLVLLSRRLEIRGVELDAALRTLPADVDAELEWLAGAIEDHEDNAVLWSTLLRRWQQIAAPIGATRRRPVGQVIGEWTKPDQDPEVVALESFYAPALRQLVRNGVLNATLDRFLAAPPGTTPVGALDVGALEQTTRILVPGAGPAGRWRNPSTELTTTQRVAVTRMSQRLGPGTSDVVAVNGPPGTGKSTLLRDFVADQVVRRAEVMVRLGPEAALPLTTVHGRTIVGVHPAVAGFEVVVAADTNRAVENVATMLNRRDALPVGAVQTHLSGPGVALDDSWWAMMAVVFGKRANIGRAMQVLAPRHGVPSWSGWLSELPTWAEARHAFEQATSEVARLTADVARRANTWRTLRRALPAIGSTLDVSEVLDQVRREETRCAEGIKEHRQTRPGWLARQLARPAWTTWVDDHERACARRDELTQLNAALCADEANWLTPIIDADGWRAMSDPLVRERHPPGVDPALEAARGDVFIAALHVHGAALATRAEAVDALFQTWSWALSSPQAFTSTEQRTLWRSAFVVVPVVTTTLASAGRMLDAFGLDELGTAIVDEASQACAHHAVPLFSKVRRALVVGDQQQLTPVVTLEPDLLEQVMRAAGADDRFSPHDASVQRLADAGSVEGTRLEVGSSSTWVGLPLRGHFRCASPMFEVANEISYGGTMIRLRPASSARSGVGGLRTTWIDVPLASGNHWGRDDRDALAALLAGLDEPPGDDLFIIAPFREVVTAAQRVAADFDGVGLAPSRLRHAWRDWAREQIGTVHTFQGREADTVILLLSADLARPRARQWAAQPPNLFNVAVTRAREHLIVIGNHEAWSAEPNAGALARQMSAHRQRQTTDPQQRSRGGELC